MGMCNDKWQNKKYNSSNNDTLMRRCLEAGWLKRWREDGLLCSSSGIYVQNVYENSRTSWTDSDEESATYERSWALPRYRHRANDLNLSWRSDR